eukprot:748099-Hanusia_phi.AAC.3
MSTFNASFKSSNSATWCWWSSRSSAQALGQHTQTFSALAPHLADSLLSERFPDNPSFREDIHLVHVVLRCKNLKTLQAKSWPASLPPSSVGTLPSPFPAPLIPPLTSMGPSKIPVDIPASTRHISLPSGVTRQFTPSNCKGMSREQAQGAQHLRCMPDHHPRHMQKSHGAVSG